jgi:hypothetical protein
MKIIEIANILDSHLKGAKGNDDKDIQYGFASDLMSDVLTLESDKVVLLTGLANIQAIRTAEMSDINLIVFVRNKQVSDDILQLALEAGITLIEYKGSMFKAVSILSLAGIKPVY